MHRVMADQSALSQIRKFNSLHLKLSEAITHYSVASVISI